MTVSDARSAALGVAKASLSFAGAWRRSVRVAIAGLGVVQALGRVPASAPEWSGFAIAVLGASLTSGAVANGAATKE
jgi:hypothetical protein